MGRHRSYREMKYEFGKQLLTLRTRISLTQNELAQEIGVHRRSVQNWETGESYPKAEPLQRLLALLLRERAFAKGEELEAARALWELAAQDGSQAIPRFDENWFARLPMPEVSPATADSPPLTRTPPSQTNPPPKAKVATSPKIIDWGEIIATPTLHGRTVETDTLQQWIVDDHCRVVTILGLGGIGKSSLAITFARQVAAEFDVVIFRSLQNGPPLAQVLDQCIRVVASQQAMPPESLPEKVALLVQLFRERRCLLILDNFETILQPGSLTGTYRTGYEEYGAFLRGMGEREHRSCLLLTSREKPSELGPLEGRTMPVRTLSLMGLAGDACQLVLETKELVGTTSELEALARLYGGNPLALNLVAEPIVEIFGGDVGAFLATDDAFFNGMSRLLDQQFARSTILEQSILYWLAIERELVPIDLILADVGEGVSQREVLNALESLRRRMLLERSPNRPAFTLQPVILEYVTDQLISKAHQEIVAGAPNLLQRYALVKAAAKEYIRRSQERLIAMPLLEGLTSSYGSADRTTQQFSELLAGWRGRPHLDQGYGPGNIANLIRLLRSDLVGMDLSKLALRHLYLQGVAAHDANLSGSHLSQSVFQEPYAGIESVACSPDMRYMAAGTVNGEIRLWEVANRTTLLAVKAHNGPVVGLALSLDGQLLASGSADGTIRLWEVATGRNMGILSGHTSVVWTVALSADRRLLISGSGDGTLRLWNIEGLQKGSLIGEQNRGYCIAVLEGHTSAVRSIALSSDGRLLASGSFDGTVRLWNTAAALDANAQGPTCLAVLTGHTDAVRSVALSPDGRIAASGSVDRTVRLWDISSVFGIDGPTPECVAVLTGHTDVIRSVVLSADGHFVASGSGDRTVRLWEIAPANDSQGASNCFAILEGHTNAVMSMALAADGQLLISGSTDGTVRLWEVQSGICLALMEGHTNAVMSVALSPNEKMLASGGTDGKVRLWDLESATHVATLSGHTNMAMGVAFSGDGKLLVSGSGDGTLRLWDVADLQNGGRCLTILEGHTNVVRGIAWSADGRLLASGSYDGTIRLWNIERGLHLCTLYGHTNMVMSVSFSQDGRLLASGSFDESVRLWDTSTILEDASVIPECVAILKDHSAVVYGVTLSADGRWLASCSFDRTVRLWDVDAILNGREDAPTNRVLSEEYRAEAWTVALSADGQWLVVGDTESIVSLWETGTLGDSQKRLALWEGHTSVIWSVALSADGRTAVSGSGDGTVRLWRDGDEQATILRAARPYERMQITGLTGVTEAQRASLLALGAIE